MVTREKMGGNRNIMHMCVSVSTPKTNKECRKDELDRFHDHSNKMSKKKDNKRKSVDGLNSSRSFKTKKTVL